jgi:cupin 2 domain-containing protein
MNPIVENIFSNIPNLLSDELFDTLLSRDTIKIERIVSEGHSSPVNDWYDQIQDEWIILLEGQATLQYKSHCSLIFLNPGDHLFIPAHTQHRVHWTTPETQTIWLAIHIYPTEIDHV